MMDKIQDISINDLHSFPDNPFKVVEGEELNLLAESIREYGVISPLIVRPCDSGGYEVIAGHRRIKACEKAGIKTVLPLFVIWTEIPLLLPLLTVICTVNTFCPLSEHLPLR